MAKTSDAILGPLIAVSHERLRLRPDHLTFLGLAAGLAAGATAAAGSPSWAMALMAVSQILDGLDGGVARRYNLASARGKSLETLSDRVCEAAIFFGLVAGGYAEPRNALLAMIAIALVTAIEPRSGFDPGFKRFMIYFGWLLWAGAGVAGFDIALQVVFIANLGAFAAGTVIAAYRPPRPASSTSSNGPG